MAELNSVKKMFYGLLDTLEEYNDLFDNEYIYKLQNDLKNYKDNLNRIGDDSKTLNIGIMGAVKAGKSSFLNALIFDGKEVLPKAAVPMTAALTKISYSKTPHAMVHFFSQSDWDMIIDNAAKYEKRIDAEYRRYEAEYEERRDSQGSKSGVEKFKEKKKNDESQTSPKLSRAEYEKRLLSGKMLPEQERASKELTEMAKGKDIISRLGEIVELDGDIIAKLNQYVGAAGKYTPIVSYVEIKIDNKALEGMEIIDTPGLDDPIVSRSRTTMDFLSKCDVAILLSPCGEFMNQGTIDLMMHNLPNAGVREYLIIGSKLDSGIQNESINDFAVARRKSLNSYEQTFETNIKKIKETSTRKDVAVKLSECPRYYVSSQMFTISRKIKNKVPLAEDEKHTLKNMSRYKGFEENERFLLSLSGISEVKKALIGVMERKEKILGEKQENLTHDMLVSVLHILDNLQSELSSGKKRLESGSAEDLNKRYSAINNVLASARKGISGVFEVSALQIEKNSRKIENDVRLVMPNYTTIKVKQETHTEHDTIKTGLFGLHKEHYVDTIIDNIADSAQVINNIQAYIGKCQDIADENFNFIFNTDNLKNEIKRLVLSAFNAAGADFEADDILVPVNTLIARIQIPQIEIDASQYIDRINSEFKSGFAKNEAVHKLTSAQSNTLTAVQDDLFTQLRSCVKSHKQVLIEQSVCFTDDISKKINDELTRLQKQINAKQEYIAKFETLGNVITKQKHMFQTELRKGK